MKTLIEKSSYENIIERINRLSPDSERLWGTMTPNQMLCHLSDPLRDILGIRPSQVLIPPPVQQQLKAVIFGDADWEHTYKTFPTYSQDKDGQGTKPTGFEQDKGMLIGLLNQFYYTPADFIFHPHAGLGVLSREEFGVYVWKHTDYHLRQFGV